MKALAVERPAYLSIARLAKELDVSESTVSELARRGVIPPPCELSPGCIRWRWDDVDAAIASRRRGVNAAPCDLMQGAIDAAKTAKEGRRRGVA